MILVPQLGIEPTLSAREGGLTTEPLGKSLTNSLLIKLHIPPLYVQSFVFSSYK